VAKLPVLPLEIIKRSVNMKGFVVMPRRWIVERTWSWLGRNRRLAKDFENLAETLAALVTVASTRSPTAARPHVILSQVLSRSPCLGSVKACGRACSITRNRTTYFSHTISMRAITPHQIETPSEVRSSKPLNLRYSRSLLNRFATT
jgi:hypothetical protein